MAEQAAAKLVLVDETSNCPAHHGLPHASILVHLENDDFVRTCIYCGALSEPRYGDEIRDNDEVPTEQFVARDDIHDRVRVLEIRYRPSETEGKPGDRIYRLERVRDGLTSEKTGTDFHYNYTEAPAWDMNPLVLWKVAQVEGIIILILVALLLGIIIF